jgi:AraC-like DNA-binding protein/Tfp pilus assembly protein PilF
MTYAQGSSFRTFHDNEIILKYKNLPAQQVLDTARHFYLQKKDIESALNLYSLVMMTIPEDHNIEHQKILTKSYYESALIHYYMNNLRLSYELLLKALELSEATDETKERAKILVGLGNIYNEFDQLDLAIANYREALNIRQDSSFKALVLNNLGYTLTKSGNLNEAFTVLHQALDLAERHRNSFGGTIRSLAILYKKQGEVDSAFYLLRRSLEVSKKENNYHVTMATYSTLGQLFLELNRLDSAIYYLNLSKEIAIKHDYKIFLMKNYLTLSEIAESKGQTATAFKYFKNYSDLRNLMFGHEKIMEISQIRELHEAAKTNRQLEKLAHEKQLKNQRLRFYEIVLILITLIALALIYALFQKRILKKAYLKLVETNTEIAEIQENSPEILSKKYQKSALSNSQQTELLSKINTLMQDSAVICDPEFSLDKLAELLQTNRTYVSQAINETLNKNFRVLVNEYRIREAQRLFAEPDVSKFTIESVARNTGFKSRTPFISAFKEVTGVTPSFYLQSIQKG